MTGLWLVLVGAYGACAGSYLGVVVDRLPAGRDLTGGSSCTGCGSRLRPFDNVPVLAYVWLRGRCFSCRAPIPALWWLLEVVSTVAWVGCAALLGPRVVLVVVLLGVWLAMLAVGVRARRQPGRARHVTAAAPVAWVAAALPAAAMAAQAVALGAAVDQQWGLFVGLGAAGAAGLLAAVVLAPGRRTTSVGGPDARVGVVAGGRRVSHLPVLRRRRRRTGGAS